VAVVHWCRRCGEALGELEQLYKHSVFI